MLKTNRRLLRLAGAFAVVVGGLVALGNSARGEDQERITVLEENDGLFFNSDKHYTQGVRIADLHPVAPAGLWNGAFDLLGDARFR